MISDFYEAALKPSGLRITQFTLLQALTLAPGIAQKELAELLATDSTTLTRTLAPLRERGWLRSETGTDRRELRHSLTAAGRREYKRVLPYWQSAQKNFQDALGKNNLDRLMDAAVRTAGINYANELAATSH